MFINILYTGKLCNELFTGKKSKRLFTSPVLFTGNAIYIRGIFIPILLVLCNRINWVSRIEEQRKIMKKRTQNYYLYMYMAMHRCDARL